MTKIEQRVVGGARPKISPGGRVGGGRDANEGAAEPQAAPGKKKSKKFMIAAVVLLVVAGAAYFLLSPAKDAGAGGPVTPVAGPVQPVEAMSLNLVDGHYLRLGLGLQLVEGVETVDDARARDAAITLFSGRSVKDVATAEGRAKLKVDLSKSLVEIYEGDVMGVYLTEFVTQ